MSITRPIARPITQSIARALTAPGVGGFNPLSLFAGGELGGIHRVDSFSHMFQDTAGTSPVTAIGQTVRRINDRTANALHVTNSTGWLLAQDSGGRNYLTMDGSSFFVSAASLPHSASMSAVVGLNHSVTATYPRGIISVRGGTAATEGFILYLVTGDNLTTRAYTTEAMAALPLSNGVASVALGRKNQATARRTARVGATSQENSTAFVTTPAAASNVSLYIGANFTVQPISGRYYGSGVIQRFLTDSEQSDWAAFFASLAGASS